MSASNRAAPSAARGIDAIGLWMRRHRTPILAVQWAVVAFYCVLLLVPAALPLPPEQAGILEHLTRFAQFVFWGLWWPFVMVSVATVGRLWCGVLCPEGALTEWISRHGLGRGIPRWLKWGGWPFVAFLGTTVYGQLVSVYEYPKAAALVLGGSTLAALAVGWVYGRGKRVWCRHLCPANGVFALLARLSSLHFRVDREAWDSAPPGTRTRRGSAVDCAPLIDVRRMQGASACHMCGRCAGERNAVTLAARAPGAELLAAGPSPGTRWEVVLLVFGMLGVALGAFQWSASPWFVAAKQGAATWLVERDWMWALEAGAPWWLLTHYPEHNDVLTWLDGALILAYIGLTATAVGLWVAGCLAACAAPARLSPWRLAYALIPLAGVSLFLGLSGLTVTLMRGEGLHLAWVDWARAGLLALGVLWSVRLAWGMARVHGAPRALAAAGGIAACAVPVAGLWIEMFYVW